MVTTPGGRLSETVGFVVFGFLGGLAFLSYARRQAFLAYGLALIGFGFFIESFSLLVNASSQPALEGILVVIRYVALGGGAAFLAYVAGTDGWRVFLEWRARRAGRASPSLLSVEAPAQAPGRGGSKNASSPRSTMGSSTTLRELPP